MQAAEFEAGKSGQSLQSLSITDWWEAASALTCPAFRHAELYLATQGVTLIYDFLNRGYYLIGSQV